MSSSFNEVWTLAILTIIEFIEILLIFKQKKIKSVIISVFIPIIISFSILYANQLNMQNMFNYSIDNKINTATINGFCKEYKKSDLQIPKYIVKGLKFYKVTSINEKAFYECKDLRHVKLPNSIKNIGNFAFAECEMLYDINIPNNLETLGARAFCNTKLENSIKISEDIKLYDYLNSYLIRDYRDYNKNQEREYYYFKEGLCLISFGYIDNTGTVVIDNTNYTPVSDFSESLAKVIREDGKYGYINASGDVVVDFEYDDAYDFSEGFALVEKDGKYGYINKKGEKVIDFEFEDPSIRWNSIIKRSYNGLFIDGIAWVKKDGKFGCIDTKGNVVVDFQYDTPFGNVIDKNGSSLNNNSDYTRVGDFSEGLAVVEKDGKYGYIDTNENVSIDFEYRDAKDFSEGLAVVYKDGKYGYISTDGKVAIDFQFDAAYDFSEGLALIKKEDKYLFINKKGEIVVDKIGVDELIFSYDSIFSD